MRLPQQRPPRTTTWANSRRQPVAEITTKDAVRMNDQRARLLHAAVGDRRPPISGINLTAATEYGCKYGRPNHSEISRRDPAPRNSWGRDFVAAPRHSLRTARPYLRPILIRLRVFTVILRFERQSRRSRRGMLAVRLARKMQVKRCLSGLVLVDLQLGALRRGHDFETSRTDRKGVPHPADASLRVSAPGRESAFSRRAIGELPMTPLARRASLVVSLLLLTSVGTASAECAWVLWESITTTGVPSSDQTRVAGGFEKRQDCIEAARRSYLMSGAPLIQPLRLSRIRARSSGSYFKSTQYDSEAV